jgi:hypothetical protein
MLFSRKPRRDVVQRPSGSGALRGFLGKAAWLRLLGLVAWLDYRLSRLRFAGLALDVALLAAAGAALAYGGVVHLALHLGWPLSVGWSVGLAVWLVQAALVRWQGFLFFRAGRQDPSPDLPALAPFHKVLMRGSGAFAVGDAARNFVEAAGAYEATELGERVLMVCVHRLSLFGLLRAPEEEWGWWYLFLRPERLRAVTSGTLFFGWRPRPALRLMPADSSPKVYLSFDDGTVRDMVARDLRPARPRDSGLAMGKSSGNDAHDGPGHAG